MKNTRLNVCAKLPLFLIHRSFIILSFDDVTEKASLKVALAFSASEVCELEPRIWSPQVSWKGWNGRKEGEGRRQT
jgi:hypothetical protein